jgi:GNAT superfamily N-acetyltransferase
VVEVEVKLNHGLVEYRHEVTLLDGGKAVIRTVRPRDRQALQAFYGRLSEETILLRYQFPKTCLTERELDEFCRIDYNDNLVLVAELDRNGPEIAGIGCYYRLSVASTAEAAFVVQDRDQNRGIGTHLLSHLSLLAKQKDIFHFTAEVSRINAKMLTIFKKSDPHLIQENTGSMCVVKVAVNHKG